MKNPENGDLSALVIKVLGILGDSYKLAGTALRWDVESTDRPRESGYVEGLTLQPLYLYPALRAALPAPAEILDRGIPALSLCYDTGVLSSSGQWDAHTRILTLLSLRLDRFGMHTYLLRGNGLTPPYLLAWV